MLSKHGVRFSNSSSQFLCGRVTVLPSFLPAQCMVTGKEHVRKKFTSTLLSNNPCLEFESVAKLTGGREITQEIPNYVLANWGYKDYYCCNLH